MVMKIYCIKKEISEWNLQLDFFILSSMEQLPICEFSNVYDIGHFSQVRFKVYVKNSVEMQSSLSYKIHDSQKDANIQITGTCNLKNKTIHFICSHDWSAYIDLCAHNVDWYLKSIIALHLKANISVNIMKPGPCRLLYQDDNYSDFHLSTEDSSGSSIPVHRIVLAAHSEVFKTMLSGEWKETAKGCLEVKGVTQQTLQHLKDYMYLGSLPEHEDLRPLLLIAKCYMMRHFEEACTVKLARTVKPESLLDLLKFSMDNHLSELIFSMFEMISHEVIGAAREAKNQTPELEEVEK